MRFISFDLETLRLIPEDSTNEDWKENFPLGISCAGLAFDDEVKIWRAKSGLSKIQAGRLVRYMAGKVEDGYTLVTWNGASFDFFVLAECSGLYDQCAELALNHVDLMVMVTFTKGWRLSLQTVCKGAGLAGKVKEVTLQDGTTIDNMDGEMAVGLWAKGDYEPVLTYLAGDVEQTLALANKIYRDKIMKWKSQSGNAQMMTVPKMLLVKDCFDIPEPDTDWMDDPPVRYKFISWMSAEVIDRFMGLPF